MKRLSFAPQTFLTTLLLTASTFSITLTSFAQPSTTWTARTTPQFENDEASQFLEMLALDGSIRTPLLLETARLARADKTAAMRYYLVHFMDRLQNARKNGLSVALEISQDNNDQKKGVASPAAQKLMNGIASLGGMKIDIGEPGRVDWSAPWDKNAARSSSISLHTSLIFMPLANAYFQTGDSKYLDRWIDYLDDWSLNDTYFDRLNPLMVPDQATESVDNTVATMRVLSRLPKEDAAKIPPRVLAQVIHQFLLEVLPDCVTYIRSNTHNWTPTIHLLEVAKIFEDFKPAQLYFREAMRRDIEDNAVTQNLRDGTENQQDPWYNTNYLTVAGALPLLATGSTIPGWIEIQNDTAWKAELMRRLKAHMTWLIHDRVAQNDLPIPWRGGAHRKPEYASRYATPAATAITSESLSDPVNSAIMKAVTGDKSADPGYDSEWFPYGGFNIVRGGWKWFDGYGAMFASPVPGAYGGFRSRSNNNTFGLNTYGEDLLIDDSTGHYMYPSSPIRVDGLDQFFHVDIYKVLPPEQHKVFQVNAWLQPANWRWHASQNFNLMEGIYSGAFGKPDEFGTLPSGAGETGISHQRLVMYARDAKLWIITDRLRSTGSHQYAQQWLIPIRPSGIFKASDLRIGLGFDPSKITLDESAKKIVTNEPLSPKAGGGKIVEAPKTNLSLYQFSALPLRYVAQPKRNGRMNGLIIYNDWDRVQATWRGTGDQQVVTLAFPRAPGTGPEGDLKSSTQITSGKNGIGFEAETPDNKTVKYLSSITPDDVLTLDNVTIHGGALLLEGDHGMALGVSKISVNGKDIPVTTPDFEFQLNGNSTPQFTPIYRSIAPVEIGPQNDVFTGKVLISLSSKTPGVNIHYTIDGSDPTPQSPLYTHPVTLTQTATILARAYRPGVTRNPPQLSGTDATVASAAYFKKVDLEPAVHSPQTSSGLDVNYYEGDWKKLFFDFENQKPLLTIHVTKLWDTSIIPGSNPIVGKNDGSHTKPYALEYQGFLNVPADGVYTFHAPQEYVWPATAAGYDLRVWVDGKLWYPSTRLHAFGTWSVALQKGAHRFRMVFIDYRSGAAAKLNRPGLNPYIWPGTTPDLKISTADLKEQLIPAAWLLH